MQAIFIDLPQVVVNTAFTASNCFATTLVVPEPLIRFQLGDVIRKLRESRGLRLRELAELADVDYTSASRLENDSNRSERRTIARVAAALKTDEAKLYAYAKMLESMTTLEGLSEHR